MRTFLTSVFTYFKLKDADQLTGYRHFVLMDAKQITEPISGYSEQCCFTVSLVGTTVVRPDWFHCYIIV